MKSDLNKYELVKDTLLTLRFPTVLTPVLIASVS